jgi:hypothetical protein
MNPNQINPCVCLYPLHTYIHMHKVFTFSESAWICYVKLLLVMMIVCHTFYAVVRPPTRYPDLLTLLWMILCFIQFAAAFIYVILIQIIDWQHQQQRLKNKREWMNRTEVDMCVRVFACEKSAPPPHICSIRLFCFLSFPFLFLSSFLYLFHFFDCCKVKRNETTSTRISTAKTRRVQKTQTKMGAISHNTTHCVTFYYKMIFILSTRQNL